MDGTSTGGESIRKWMAMFSELDVSATTAAATTAQLVESMTAPNVWTKMAVFTDLNNTVVPNLQPGTVYTFRVCAMAAGNQQSEWSAPLSAMNT